MKNPFLFFSAVVISCSSFGQAVIKSMKRLPDTGETTSYTTTFGEDNDYTINPPYFTINGNGTVTDTVTGLMWQQKDGGEMTIERAIYYCDTLTLGGYTDWRLPLPHEGFSILNHQYANPAVNTTVFTTTTAQYWWTSERQANDTTKIWVTNAGGGIGNHPKSETISAGGTKIFSARAVRDVTPPPTIPNRFTDNGNGTITDNLTTLVWQKIVYSDSITWEQALTYADTLALNGNTDWRLPNIKELESIDDESLVNPSINRTFFSTMVTNKYWSSSSLPNQPTKAWYLDTQFGITTYDFKTLRHYLICVRGIPSITTNINRLTNTLDQINIYPNPATTMITITSSANIKEIKIINLLGEVVSTNSPTNNQSTIDISQLSKGIYFIEVQADGSASSPTNNVIRKKFVKQ